MLNSKVGSQHDWNLIDWNVEFRGRVSAWLKDDGLECEILTNLINFWCVSLLLFILKLTVEITAWFSCTNLIFTDPVKPGQCPRYANVRNGNGKCYTQCRVDVDCPGNQKCCVRGCSLLCLNPVSNICMYDWKAWLKSFFQWCVIQLFYLLRMLVSMLYIFDIFFPIPILIVVFTFH